jgi:hypothetical protein
MAQTFEIEGTLKQLFDTQTFASGFAKREFVVEVPDGKYPQMLKFECVKEKISILEGIRVGDFVKIAFDIRGSEYKERFYVNLNAWKITKGQGGDGESRIEREPSSSAFDSQFDNEPDSSDEIPF